MQKLQSSLQKSRTIGNYIITKNLGQGTFGKVKLGIHSGNGQKVAIKILQKSKIADVADVQRVTRQIYILKQIRHPNLIQLYQIIQTPKQLFLVMEYVSQGELFQHIVKKKRLKENEACQLFRQLIQGVLYLHELNIVHRDLKPENLLIDFNRRLKIVDFGLSNTYKNKELLKTACGSPCYAAPEMIAGKKYQGLNADIWSCGVILFAMICGYLPFQDPNTSALYKKITSGDYTIPKYVSPFARDLLQRILTTDPQRRIKISEIKKHAWYRQPIQLQFNQTCGIKLGINNIPIDQIILTEVVSTLPQNGYQQTRKFISSNRHNHAITVYYLLLKRNLRNGIHSKFDICSPDFQLANLQKSSQVVNAEISGNKNNEDIEEIQLDRNTTATGFRDFRSNNRSINTRINNVSQSPDITAHNFYTIKQKQKPKSKITEVEPEDISKFINANQSINQPPSTQRRKIYFQAPARSILTNSVDLKSYQISTINSTNLQELQQKPDKSLAKPIEKKPHHPQQLEISLYDIQDKRQTLSHFYHQQRRPINSVRQSINLHTNLNKSYRISSTNPTKKFEQFSTHTARQTLLTRDAHNANQKQRYASLQVGSGNQIKLKGRNNPQQNRFGQYGNDQDNMNKTFTGSMKNRIPKVFGFKLQDQGPRVKSILNNTITTGWSKKRRTISTRQRDEELFQ